jgi:hypothetical protein
MFGFLIAVGAGFLVPQLEAPIARPVIAGLRKVFPLETGEARTISFMIAMLIAAFVASIFDTGQPIGLSIGLILGYFGTRILAVFNGKKG